MATVVLIVMVVITVVVGYWLIFGRTSGLKKKWDAGVIAKADELGAVAVKKTGAFSFSALRFDDLGPTPVIAMVFNGLPLEPSIAGHYRHFNTNDWLTLVEADFTNQSGVGFSCGKGEGALAYKEKVNTGDGTFDATYPVFSDAPEDAARAWTTKARELMSASGEAFTVLSGGVKVTAVTRGVVADAGVIRAMAEVVGELARCGGRPA